MTQETSAEPSERTAPPAATRRSSGAGKVIALLLVLLLAVGGYASFPLWRGYVGFPAPANELVALRAALASLADRLTQLETSLSQPGEAGLFGRLAAVEQKVADLPQDAAQLAPRVETLAKQVEAVRRDVAEGAALAQLPAQVDSLARQVDGLHKTTADAATLLKLYARVDETEKALRSLEARHASAAGLLLAVGQLREAVDRGQPFDAELRTVKVLAGDDTEVATQLEILRPYAESGIVSRVGLGGRLDRAAAEIVRAEMLPEEPGWSRNAANRMLSLVSIRREPGVVAGNDAAAILARAEADLNGGDLAAAIGELDSLGQGSAQAAAPWLAQAKARVAADKAVSELTAHAIALAGARP
ncbi:COG4223 family protein [Phaeospirillum tilakii]|uniref:COG4223 family protein n=1 Tax=Phaeospirillum tilakii TaxID=741673 RepID=A0ABW5C6G6_9PROT